MSKRTKWTWAQIQEFRDWHERRLHALNYPESVVLELTKARESWLATIQIKEV